MRVYEVMSKDAIGSLVVTSSNGKVAGIVTVADLLNLLARTAEHASNRALRKAREERGWEPD